MKQNEILYRKNIYIFNKKEKNRFKCTVQFCSKHKQKICLSHYRKFVYIYVQVYNINQWLTIATQYTQTEVNVNPICYPKFSTNFHCKKKTHESSLQNVCKTVSLWPHHQCRIKK